MNKLAEETEQLKADIEYAETMADHKKAAGLMQRLQTMKIARDELEARMEE